MFLLSLVCLPRSHDVRPSASEGFLCHFLFPRETANFLSVCKPQMSRKKSFQEKVSQNDHETWNLGAFFFEDYPDAGRTLWARINHDNYYQICILHEMELAISEHLGAIIIESKCGRERLSPALGDYQNWGDKLFLRIIFLRHEMARDSAAFGPNVRAETFWINSIMMMIMIMVAVMWLLIKAWGEDHEALDWSTMLINFCIKKNFGIFPHD